MGTEAVRFLVLCMAGWIHARQLEVIDFLREENRVLRDQLGGRRLRFTDDQRRRLAVKGRIVGRRRLGEFAGVRPPHHAADLHPPGLEVDHEQHQVANEPSEREHLDREESVAAITPRCVRRKDEEPDGLSVHRGAMVARPVIDMACDEQWQRSEMPRVFRRRSFGT
jgi:hypothetical protein